MNIKYVVFSSGNVLRAAVLLLGLLAVTPLFAHHILGRPSYSLNEDSNTPPSMQAELQAGSYDVLYMAYPAFPKVDERGRVNLHISHIESGETFIGEVTFRVKSDSLFSSETELIGVQKIDDGVYRQGFVFKADGEYTILAEFSEGEHTHVMSFPLRVGAPSIIGSSGYVVGIIFFVLLIVSLINRKKLQQERIKRHHSDNNDPQVTS